MSLPVRDLMMGGDPPSPPLRAASTLGVDVRTEPEPEEVPPGPPHAQQHVGDCVFAGIVRLFGIAVLLTPALMFLSLLTASTASLRRSGLGFITSSSWDPVHERFGALP